MAQKIITSETYELIKQDIKKWAYNMLTFSAPSIILGLIAFQKDWDWKVGVTAIGMGVLNALIDLLKKFLQENRYVK